jgi:hypothetical protein
LRRAVLATPHDRCGPFYRPRGNILAQRKTICKCFFAEIDNISANFGVYRLARRRRVIYMIFAGV